MKTLLCFRMQCLIAAMLCATFACEPGSTDDPSGNAQEVHAEFDRTIMLLGVYHFSNPGKDAFNLEIDDYLSDRRQEEIREVVDLLSDFRPNRILVELMPDRQPVLDSIYSGYLAGDIELADLERGENEVYQLGFRLGKAATVSSVTAIDHPGIWLGSYVDFIADTLNYENYVTDREQKGRSMEALNRRFQDNSVRENLAYTNSRDAIAANHDYYNNVALPVADTVGIAFTRQEIAQEIDGLPYTLRSFDFENIGIELVTEWYRRNLFIYRNILEATSDGDRILVIIGQGHVRILQQLLEDNPKFGLVDPLEYLSNE